MNSYFVADFCFQLHALFRTSRKHRFRQRLGLILRICKYPPIVTPRLERAPPAHQEATTRTGAAPVSITCCSSMINVQFFVGRNSTSTGVNRESTRGQRWSKTSNVEIEICVGCFMLCPSSLPICLAGTRSLWISSTSPPTTVCPAAHCQTRSPRWVCMYCTSDTILAADASTRQR